MAGSYADILMFTVVGDALGTPFTGLRREHIAAVFKKITDYTDVFPALKSREFLWKKPGLYSSVSQFALLFSLFADVNFSAAKYVRLVAFSPDVPDSQLGVFRWPEDALARFISACIQGKDYAPYSMPCASVPLVCLHIGLFARSKEEAASSACRLASAITKDALTIACACIYAQIVYDGSHAGGVDPFILADIAADCSARVIKFADANSAELFDMGVSPASFKHGAEVCGKAFAAQTEQEIVAAVNSTVKTPVTRATAPLPLAVLPFAALLLRQAGGSPDVLFTAAAQGGSAGVLTAAVGSFVGLFTRADDIPTQLAQGLVNKKKIAQTIALTGRRQTGGLEEFFASEQGLTVKAEEEFKAKVKNVKQKGKQVANKQSKGSKEERLAAHIVESWTKLDKARYKKEKQRAERDGQGE